MTCIHTHSANGSHRVGKSLNSTLIACINYVDFDAGGVSCVMRYVVGETILDDAEMSVAAQVAEYGLTLAREHDATWTGDSHRVHADGEKARQILINLLSNATKFTPPGGHIVLGCSIAGKCVEIRVSDTGRGIEAEDLAKVFEPFVQIDRMSTPRPQQGVGLGLAISRDLARGMGGDLTVSSTPGAGSTFTLILPCG